MREIINNCFFELLHFYSVKERNTFLKNSIKSKLLNFNESYGNNYYCLIQRHSLTNQIIKCIIFDSDNGDDSLLLLYWDNKIVISIDDFIYFIDDKFELKFKLKLLISLIGLYLTSENKLLILQETEITIVNTDYYVEKNESIDFVVDFHITNNCLIIKTEKGDINYSV